MKGTSPLLIVGLLTVIALLVIYLGFFKAELAPSGFKVIEFKIYGANYEYLDQWSCRPVNVQFQISVQRISTTAPLSLNIKETVNGYNVATLKWSGMDDLSVQSVSFSESRYAVDNCKAIGTVICGGIGACIEKGGCVKDTCDYYYVDEPVDICQEENSKRVNGNVIEICESNEWKKLQDCGSAGVDLQTLECKHVVQPVPPSNQTTTLLSDQTTLLSQIVNSLQTFINWIVNNISSLFRGV